MGSLVTESSFADCLVDFNTLTTELNRFTRRIIL